MRPNIPHVALGAVFLALGLLSGCKQDPFCEFPAQCVEGTCGTPAFLSCGPCPEGSFDARLCDARSECEVREGDGLTHECTTAANCEDGEACACRASEDGTHRCVPAYCAGPADCGSLPCAPVLGCAPAGRSGVEVRAYRCMTVDDTCRSATGCATGELCAPDVASPEAPPLAGEGFQCISLTCG